LIEGGVGALLRARDAGDVSAPTGRTSASPSGQPTVPPIVAVEDEAQRIESVYDQIEEEQKKSAERIAAWRDQVRQQELEREYREYGEQIERLEKERMESERRAADEAEKQAREIGRVRMDAERAAANAWDSTGGGLGASLLAVMGTAEQQLASYQASRARGNAEMRADYIERAVEAVLRKITVNTNVVRGGVIAAPV
jgi:chromosome segregation ATPase